MIPWSSPVRDTASCVAVYCRRSCWFRRVRRPYVQSKRWVEGRTIRQEDQISNLDSRVLTVCLQFIYKPSRQVASFLRWARGTWSTASRRACLLAICLSSLPHRCSWKSGQNIGQCLMMLTYRCSSRPMRSELPKSSKKKVTMRADSKYC